MASVRANLRMMGERGFTDNEVATHLGYAALALVVFLKNFFCYVKRMSVFPMQTTQGVTRLLLW